MIYPKPLKSNKIINKNIFTKLLNLVTILTLILLLKKKILIKIFKIFFRVIIYFKKPIFLTKLFISLIIYDILGNFIKFKIFLLSLVINY